MKSEWIKFFHGLIWIHLTGKVNLLICFEDLCFLNLYVSAHIEEGSVFDLISIIF